MSLRYNKDALIPNEFSEESHDKDVHDSYSDECDEYEEDSCTVCGTLLPESLICLQCGKDNTRKNK